MLGPERKRSRWTMRRMMMPLAILIAAAGIGMLASHQSRQQINTVQAHLRELCRLAAHGDPLQGHVLVNEASIEATTIAAIERACESILPDLSNLRIHVAPGELGHVDQRRGQWTGATHRASIVVDGEPQLDLRLRIGKETMDRVVILGYVIPGYELDDDL